MAKNTTSVTYDSTTGFYGVNINSKQVILCKTQSDANILKQRLDGLFSDPDRDLDCITPSHDGSNYTVICPLVRRNAGKSTYTITTGSIARQMYEPTYANDGKNSSQTLLYVAPSTSSAPWYDALIIANLIRAAVNLHFADAAGKTTCSQLKVPTNKTSQVASVIKNKDIHYAYYGAPNQGSSSTSNDKIWSFNVGNTEVFHPCDMICALTSTSNWDSTYRNKFIKVTNNATQKSLVLRVTDTAPEDKGVEPAYRPHMILGLTSGGNKDIKLELMQ